MELVSLAQLDRCHRRHDDVMAELLEAARRLAAGRPDDGDLDRVREAVAYFERAVTRHFVDEEGSVFPRLSTRRPELASALAELSAEHPVQIAMQADVAAAAHELDGEARPAAGKALLDAALKLAEAHRAHVGREDAIFAAAHEALTAEDDAEIVAEMETRRDRDDNGGHHRRGHAGGGGGGGGGGGHGGGRGRMQAPADTEAEPAAKAPPARTGKSASRTKLGKRASSVAARRGAKRPAKPAARAAAKRAAKKPSSRPVKRAGVKRTKR